MTIKDNKYYESDTNTVSDAQGNLTCDLKTVTHTINGKGKVTDTNNGNYGQKIFSNRTLPIVVPTMNLRIVPRIVLIGGATQMLLMAETKEVVAHAMCGGA